jgi:hypothetical protein
MSATSICPICGNSGIRPSDEWPSWQSCECLFDPVSDAIEETQQAVFKLLFHTLQGSKFSRVFDGVKMMHNDKFNGHLYAVSEAVAKAYHGK